MEKILQRIIKGVPKRNDHELADAYLKLAQAKQIAASLPPTSTDQKTL